MKKKKESQKTIVFETFRQIGSWTIRDLTDDAPSCFNGEVRVRKYKVTIEPVEESREEIIKRIQTLWDESDNYHDSEPLERAAKEIGYELIGSRGNNRKKK